MSDRELYFVEIMKTIEKVHSLVKKRIEEFEKIGTNEDILFKELCFCLLTANFTAQGGMRIQEAIGDDFLKMEEGEIARKLRVLGHRYPKVRAAYIVEARKFYGMLGEKIRSSRNAWESREWFVENIKGFGYKEASHFLRNVGFKDVAIIDRHVLRFLNDNKLIEEVPKSLSRKKYLELEKLLSAIANRLKLSLAELDLYIWYTRTGKILK